MQYDYLIVGAGLFGATISYELTKEGKKCLVIDKRNHIAGNIYTSFRNEIHVHEYGAHIFHTSNKDIWKYVNQFTEFNHYINAPLAVYKDEIYNLPFNMNTFSKMWNIKTPQEAKDIIENQIKELNLVNPKNLEEQALSLVGTDIYEKLVKGYTEKQWGRSCKELPAFIIKRLPVRFVYDNNYFNDPYQGIPHNGYTNIVEKMLQNTEVRLSTEFIEYVNWDMKTTKDGHSFEKLIYTGPIDEFFEYQLGFLEYRSLKFETIHLKNVENYQGNAVVNYTEKDIPYTRIIEHKHFNFSKAPSTIISKEFPAEWKVGVERFYPVNDEKNMSLFQQYQELAKQHNDIYFGGRLGQYKYFDMDKTIESALELADCLLNNKKMS